MDRNNTLHFQQFLHNVAVIKRQYEETAKSTGENFNIFSIMRAEGDEVRTHSRIIAELLNPKGMHSQGTAFLKLFFKEINILEYLTNDFQFDHVKVLVEEYLGPIDQTYTQGGFIDIVIKDSKKQIVIENKIYASDQKGQLLRYKKNYPDCHLVYLTLFGSQPSEFSYIGEESFLKLDDIILVSYRDIIKSWIEKCIAISESKPIIRETLIQYLNLIKKLTNQTINDKMSNDIVAQMEKEIHASFEISNNITQLKKKLYNDLIQLLKDTVPNTIVDTDHPDYYGLDVHCSNFSTPIRILFGKKKEFEKDLCNNVSCGYQVNIALSVELINNYAAKGFIANSSWVYKWINSGSWGNSPEIWEDLAKGREGKTYNEIIESINEILSIEQNVFKSTDHSNMQI